MESFEVIEGVRRRLALSIEQFMEAAGLSRDAYYRWKRGETAPTDTTVAQLESAHGIVFVRGRGGDIVGVEKVSSPDIDSPPLIREVGPGYETGSLTEEQMIDMYEAIARRSYLPRWEDLDDAQKLEVKREIVYLNNETERVRRASESAIIELFQKRRKA